MTTIDFATTTYRRSRDSVLVVLATAIVLVAAAGGSVRNQGEEMQPGVIRDIVLAVGKPTGWVADRLPLDDIVHDATAWLSPDGDLASSGDGRFGGGTIRVAGGAGAAIPAVTADDFDLSKVLGTQHPTKRLERLLVTGDSLSIPVDSVLARRLSTKGVKVTIDPHIGTGISKPELLDWGKLAQTQAKKLKPDAIVMFIGANDSFDMTSADGRRIRCCGLAWAVEYATRARAMMSVYRQGGKARVYWMSVPAVRDKGRNELATLINEAVRVAGTPYTAQVRQIDLGATFTPGNRFRSTMSVGGRDRIVRAPDGIHLNDTGAEVAADLVVEAMRRDFVNP
jgi:lysophospholipase L1-like esterase